MDAIFIKFLKNFLEILIDDIIKFPFSIIYWDQKKFKSHCLAPMFFDYFLLILFQFCYFDIFPTNIYIQITINNNMVLNHEKKVKRK